MSSVYTGLTESSHKRWWFAGLMVLLCLPPTALIQEYLGYLGIAIYTIGVFIALLLMLRFEESIYQLIEKRYAFLIALMVVGLVIIFAIIYPLETAGKLSRGSDRDEALNQSVISLVQGQLPLLRSNADWRKDYAIARRNFVVRTLCRVRQ